MRLIQRSVVIGIALLGATGVPAVAAAQATFEKAPPVKLAKATADVITAEQLKSRTFPDVYQAIEALRGNWLRNRNLNPPGGALINPNDPSKAGGGSSSSTGLGAGGSGMPRDAAGIQVYLDGTRLGGIETLKSLPVVTVYSIRRISGTDAQARFGIGHSDGVIYVATDPSKVVK